jgi:hypothetical protein
MISMTIEASWIARFLDYASAVAGYWQFWVAVAFMLERSLERYLPAFWSKVDLYLTQKRRRKVFVWIAAIAFLYANFRAYDDVNISLRKAQAENQSANYREQQEKALLAVKEILGATISEGEKLISDWQKADEKQLESNANAWATKADNFVLAAFGGGEQAVFRSDAGYQFYSDGSRLNEIRNWVDGRLRRLNDLLQRSTSIPLQREFDVGKFRWNAP